MGSRHEQIADWTDEAAYAPLLRADRTAFAWEWLRRAPGYREAAAGIASGAGQVPDEGARRWGLHAFEAPWLRPGEARPMWRRELLTGVLVADARDHGDPAERLDLERLRRFVTLLKGPDGLEHLLLSDGRRTLRLDIDSGTLTGGPVLLEYRLSGVQRLSGQLLSLRQLLSLYRHGQFAQSLHRPEVRAARWVLILRTHDALAAGACQREIAERLLDRDAAAERWRVRAPALRSRAQRLVREAGIMAAGGYLSFLRRR